jgi:hypothetical protein
MAQTSDVPKRMNFLQRGIFITSNSNYQFTKCTSVSGEIKYGMGFLNVDSMNANVTLVVGDGSTKFRKATPGKIYSDMLDGKYCIDQYVLLPGIDTVFSFHDNMHEYIGEQDTLIRDVHYSRNDLLVDIRFSDVLKTIGEDRKEQENELTLLIPLSWYTGYEKWYNFEFIKIGFNKDQAFLRHAICRSVDSTGIQKLDVDSMPVPVKDLQKLIKAIDLAQAGDSTNLFPTDPFLIFYKSENKQIYVVECYGYSKGLIPYYKIFDCAYLLKRKYKVLMHLFKK